MKKKIMCIAVIAIVATASWNYTQNRNANRMSDLALANVEALANKVPPSGGNCTEAANCSCSFVVATPGGNHSETYYDQRMVL